MYLHEMTVAARLESITQIATKLAGAPANVSFDTQWPSLVISCDDPPIVAPCVMVPCTVLRVSAVDGRPRPREWKLGAPGIHTETAVAEVLSHAMLLSLAHQAQVCPQCHQTLARRAGTERYHCSCGMVVLESES